MCIRDRAYSIAGYRVQNAAEFASALEQAIASKQPAVIECVLDIDEKVRPMIPGGGDLDQYLLD